MGLWNGLRASVGKITETLSKWEEEARKRINSRQETSQFARDVASWLLGRRSRRSRSSCAARTKRESGAPFHISDRRGIEQPNLKRANGRA